MNTKKVICIVGAILLVAFFVIYIGIGNSSMEEQAWKEATTYVEWLAEQENVSLKPGVYSKDRVIKNSDDNYTCCVAVTMNDGGYDQWYITVEKKSDGDWDVMSVE